MLLDGHTKLFLTHDQRRCAAIAVLLSPSGNLFSTRNGWVACNVFYTIKQAIRLVLQLRVSTVQSSSFWIEFFSLSWLKLIPFTLSLEQNKQQSPIALFPSSLCTGMVGRIAENGHQTHEYLCLTINCAFTQACKVMSFCIFSLEICPDLSKGLMLSMLFNQCIVFSKMCWSFCLCSVVCL